MSYQTRNDVPLKPLRHLQAQAVVELDTGDLVALNYAAVRTTGNTLSCQASAWLIDADGDPQATVDAAGVPVLTEFRHNASAALLTRVGGDAIAGALNRLVLGESADVDDAIKWPQDVRDSVSIRNAIVVARASGPLADIGAVL